MPSFTVTAAGQSVQLDQTGGGQAAFTVTNTTATALTGRLIVTPQAPAAATWFTVAGPSTRTFAPGTAESVTVQVVVPPGTAPGTYTFRLDAIAEDNPDEDFTEGPPVSFEVKPAPVAAKKPFPWWIVIIVALVLVGGGIAFALTRGGNKLPPPAVSTPAKDAVITGNPPVLTVSWAPVTDADHYRVEVQHCASAACDKDVLEPFDLTTSTTTQQFQVGLGNGRVRVTALKGGKSGETGAFVAFTAQAPGGGACPRCKVPLDVLKVHPLTAKEIDAIAKTRTTP
ncbi:MAG: hypothetical protein ACXVFN_00250 [Solirubrobacteraceae bacterium]